MEKNARAAVKTRERGSATSEISALKEIKVKEKSAETPAQIVASRESLFVFIKIL